ncbi:MAG: polymer-forming cytoskeletal protein [Chitinophagaceae bacterium]|nr:polymer-forming cytoskeletal protein [Chitinophagaceae bacterium]
MKKIFSTGLLLAITLHVFAFRIEYGNNIIISKPVYEDLYIAGGTVTINAPIYGDLIIAGGTIIINDTVTNDILVVGGKVTLNGYVGDDIRCAGGNINISKNVHGDVVVTGGAVIINKGVTIGGLLASGGDVTIDGNIDGELKGAFGDVFINGHIAKDVDCRGGRITVNGSIAGKTTLAARYIVIGDQAAFNNDIRYWNKREAIDLRQSLKNGKAVFDPSLRIHTGEWYYLGSATILGLLWYLGMALLMIFVFQYLFSATVKKAADTVFNNTLKSLGFGLLFFAAVPVLAIVAFISIIGVPIGILLVFGYIVLLLLATVVTAVVAANWYNNRTGRNWRNRQIIFSAFGLFILLKMVSMVPFAGWIIMACLVCISFGSILLNINRRRKQPALAV